MSRPPPLPSPEEGRALHARLLAGDPVAPAELAEAYLDHLAGWLQARNRGVRDPHLHDEAAEDALLALIKDPGSYDPARLGLTAYLHMSAQGDLRNLLAKERRRHVRQVDLTAVELSPARGKELWDTANDPARIVECAADAAAPPVPTLPDLTAAETAVLALMQDRERDNGAYARVLGIADSPIAEQRREVKRVKDRLKKRLARARGTDVRAPR
ncbi:MAG TPA: sigma factor [Thermomicrobiales bacterium]|nr:sigma factor [Thermomicrobiales bacterium]